MKKRLLLAAVSAALISPLAAQAAATVYGNVHLSIDSTSLETSGTDPVTNKDPENLTMNNNTSAIGVKGKEDLGGGMSAIFKLEFQIDPSERNKSITDRDQWVGLKGAMGTIKFGTMSNNYKMLGGKIDPMYRTQLEGRGFMDIQTSLHGGAGENGGRSTNTLQYSSPKMGGMKFVFNYTFSGKDDETLGFGLHYKTKTAIAFIDYLDVQSETAPFGNSETAFKIGGSYKMGAVTLGLQYESVEDVNLVKNVSPSDGTIGNVGSDVIFASMNYTMNPNNNIAFTLGDNGTDDVGYALMYNHKMSKRTNVYTGYGDNASMKADDKQVITFGVRHKF